MQDVFVGIVTCAAGLWFIISAVTDHPFLFSLQKIRWTESTFGRLGSRIFVATLGIAFIVLGIAICSGWRMRLFG
jgi:hypothetical protein